MTTTINHNPDLVSRCINGILAIKPLVNLAKHQARQMMIKRAEKIGVPWTQEVEKLQQRDWVKDLSKVENPQIKINYPEYYLRPFHAYEHGNLSWPA
ncbi:MAG: SAM-dependent methyltransferase, partial [Dolichospermum sp.]